MTFSYPLNYDSWDDKEIDAINRIVKSKMFTMGVETERFEEEFAKFVGTKYAVMVNSGSSANLAMMFAMLYSKKLKKGDVVLVPKLGWSTTYFPIAQIGCKLAFMDIDNTFNIDIDHIINYLSASENRKKVKAIVAVNVLGNTCDIVALQRICNRYNLTLLIDNCESLGAMTNNTYTPTSIESGTAGLMGTYSMFYSHHMSAMEGGVITTNSSEMYQYLIAIRSHGWTRHLPERSIFGDKSQDYFENHWKFVVPGFNIRPTEISAAIARVQLSKMPESIATRIGNYNKFKGKWGVIGQVKSNEYWFQNIKFSSSHFGFAIVMQDYLSNDRTTLMRFLNQHGIETRPIISGDFTKQDVMQYILHDEQTFRYASANKHIIDHVHKYGFMVGNTGTEYFSDYHFDTIVKCLNGKK